MAGRIGLIGTLLLVPVTVILRWVAPDRSALIFVVAGLAIVPLGGQIGRATDDLADKLGVGGLLNATFGNAAELILSGFALHRGLTISSRRRLRARSSPTSCSCSARPRWRAARAVRSCRSIARRPGWERRCWC